MHMNKANPFEYIREITDPNIFAGRRYELKAIEQELSNFAAGKAMRTTALIGPPRVGKTSILLRIAEICETKKIFPVLIELETLHTEDPWEFWFKVFFEILSKAKNKGIVQLHASKPLTFRFADEEDNAGPKDRHLLIEEQYESYAKGIIKTKTPSEAAVEHDLKLLMQSVVFKKNYRAILLMFDEAHKLQESKQSRLIKESLRNLFLSKLDRAGLIFAGYEKLGNIFVGNNEPFNGRGHNIPVTNFTVIEDIRECALSPLDEEDRLLMSPMTIDYIALLSRGMPNFIRMICYAIYERFSLGKQEDLNLTIAIMEDLLEVMERDAAVKGKMSDLVNKIKGLTTVDLELLYNMARYPNWSIEQVVDLDESFRGEASSENARVRRTRILGARREEFVKRGLLDDEPGQFVMSGGDFVSGYANLYLRFWYEVQKYGELTRNIIIGKGPRTTFGEKADKLSNAISWEVKTFEGMSFDPRIEIAVIHQDYKDKGQLLVDRVLERYKTFDQIKKGQLSVNENTVGTILECLEVCKLVDKPGSYLLICLSVRNAENHREVISLELYYRIEKGKPPFFNLGIFSAQAKEAKITIEGHAQSIVDMPDLDGLCKQFGSSLNEYLNILDFDDKWLIGSIQHLISQRELERKDEKEKEDIIDGKWLEEYDKDHAKNAEAMLTKKIAMCLGSDSKDLATLYNDRGYMYSNTKTRFLAARDDLERAYQYHYTHISITLLNLAYLDIVEEKYDPAIEQLQNVLLITHSREEISAGYLRTVLPESKLLYMKSTWEHRPANILEASYILLAYVTYKKEQDLNKGIDILNEGKELLPSSVWIRHALARFYLSNHQANLTGEIYRELGKSRVADKSLQFEIDRYLSRKH